MRFDLHPALRFNALPDGAEQRRDRDALRGLQQSDVVAERVDASEREVVDGRSQRNVRDRRDRSGEQLCE